LPDLSFDGLGVRCGWGQDYQYKLMATDFPCESDLTITDIHLWAGWQGDDLPDPYGDGDDSAEHVNFLLSIHASSTVHGPAPGHPGKLLWCVYVSKNPSSPTDTTFDVHPYHTGEQGWIDPNTGAYVLNDHSVCWQYNFHIHPDDQITLEGLDAWPYYWLVVEAFPYDLGGQTAFGWKTADPDALPFIALPNWIDEADYTGGDGDP
jgi:hypothetical protein